MDDVKGGRTLGDAHIVDKKYHGGTSLSLSRKMYQWGHRKPFSYLPTSGGPHVNISHQTANRAREFCADRVISFSWR